MKKILIRMIKFYRKSLSHLKSSPCCKYYPTCSQYALTAVERFGAVRGSVLAIWRILRCNPYSHGGVDFVPDRFHLYFLKREGAQTKDRTTTTND